MNSKKSTNSLKKTHWYEEPTKKFFAIFMGFFAVAGIGYGFGVWQKDVEIGLKEIKLNQDCNERVQNEINNCKKVTQDLENDRVANLESVVLELQKNINGSK